MGVVRWGKRLSREASAGIGIDHGRVPAPSVWCELFQALDITSLERIPGAWVQGGQAAGHVAIDGKRLRGSATVLSPGAGLVAAFSASLEGVIGQLRMKPEANEITAALQLLKTVPLTDLLVTGDAMFTQREICRAIRDGGGDYFFTVKDNQLALNADIALAFGPTSPPSAEWSPPSCLRCAQTIEKSHGRIETRRLETAASLAALLPPTWSGLAQVCRITRQRIIRGKTSTETIYALQV